MAPPLLQRVVDWSKEHNHAIPTYWITPTEDQQEEAVLGKYLKQCRANALRGLLGKKTKQRLDDEIPGWEKSVEDKLVEKTRGFITYCRTHNDGRPIYQVPGPGSSEEYKIWYSFFKNQRTAWLDGTRKQNDDVKSMLDEAFGENQWLHLPSGKKVIMMTPQSP